jgi:poly(3-hydroxybutyrate) depolymerase
MRSAELLCLKAASLLLLAACSTTESNPGGSNGVAGSGGSGTTAGSGGMAQPPCAGTAPVAGSDSGAAGSAGAGGAAMGGAAGAAGQGGSAGGGPLPPKPSTGCNKAATETPEQFTKHSLMSGGKSRDFYTYLPGNYDPTRAYPTIFAFHPCGGSGNPSSNVPIQNASGDDAIIISPQSVGGCYENQIRSSPEVPFFDDTLKYAKENYCVDENRVFAIGHSAGSWMAIILGCERGDVLRAHAQVSGGLPIFVKPSDCRGKVASLYLHDSTDVDNNIIGGYAGRDRSWRFNGCSDTKVPWEPAPCQEYQGCKPGYPVVFCETTGEGHGRQDDFAPDLFWKFFSQF